MPPLQVGLCLEEEEVLSRMRHVTADRIRCVLRCRVYRPRQLLDVGTSKERWVFIRDWEEHKQEAGRKFEEYFKSPSLGSGDTEKMRRPLREWIH